MSASIWHYNPSNHQNSDNERIHIQIVEDKVAGKDTADIVGQKPAAVGSLRNLVGVEAVVFRSLVVDHIVAVVVHKKTAHTRFGMEVEARLMVGLGNLV